VAGARCIYCGALLPEAPAASSARGAAIAPVDRVVVVVDMSADAHALADALGRSDRELEALRRRRRYLLHRILPEAEAAADVARLRALGVDTIALSESVVRAAAQPLRAIGGNPEAGVFTLDGEKETRQVAADDVLLVVWGPIRREPLSETARTMRDLRRIPAKRAVESDLYHVHTRSSLRPLELDPDAFTFTETRGSGASTLLRVRAAIAGLAAAAEVDRGFAQEAPALGVSSGPPRTSFAEAFGARRSAGGQRKPAMFLDNVAQFRLYSAWRGIVARRLAGLADTAEPPL
jgi:hypothetical protein